MEMSGNIHAPAILTPGKRIHGTYWIDACVGPSASLDVWRKEKSLAPATDGTTTPRSFCP
jgi:hypothetical protein